MHDTPPVRFDEETYTHAIAPCPACGSRDTRLLVPRDTPVERLAELPIAYYQLGCMSCRAVFALFGHLTSVGRVREHRRPGCRHLRRC